MVSHIRQHQWHWIEVLTVRGSAIGDLYKRVWIVSRCVVARGTPLKSTTWGQRLLSLNFGRHWCRFEDSSFWIWTSITFCFTVFGVLITFVLFLLLDVANRTSLIMATLAESWTVRCLFDLNSMRLCQISSLVKLRNESIPLMYWASKIHATRRPFCWGDPLRSICLHLIRFCVGLRLKTISPSRSDCLRICIASLQSQSSLAWSGAL